jgi:hypothetical protein
VDRAAINAPPAICPVRERNSRLSDESGSFKCGTSTPPYRRFYADLNANQGEAATTLLERTVPIRSSRKFNQQYTMTPRHDKIKSESLNLVALSGGSTPRAGKADLGGAFEDRGGEHSTDCLERDALHPSSVVDCVAVRAQAIHKDHQNWDRGSVLVQFKAVSSHEFQ